MTRMFRLATLTATIVATASAAGAQETYRITDGRIAVVCSLTVGGSFEAKTRNLSGRLSVPPADGAAVSLPGTFQVDFQTLETGIGLRDRHMRANYLEVDKGDDFAMATFSDLRLESLDGKTGFTGTLKLHGQSRLVKGTAKLQRRDGSIRVQAQFPLRLSEFQIPSPTYLGVGVRDEVQVTVILTAFPGTSHFVGTQSRR